MINFAILKGKERLQEQSLTRNGHCMFCLGLNIYFPELVKYLTFTVNGNYLIGYEYYTQ